MNLAYWLLYEPRVEQGNIKENKAPAMGQSSRSQDVGLDDVDVYGVSNKGDDPYANIKYPSTIANEEFEASQYSNVSGEEGEKIAPC